MAAQAETSDPVNIYILDIGEHVVNYNVPSFPVFSAQLRSVKFQLGVIPDDKNRRVDTAYDGFIRKCPSLQWNYPACIVIDRSTSDSPDSFSVCVQEFSQAVDVTDFVLYDGGVCVIWKWKWGENVFEAPDSSFSVQNPSDQPLSCQESPASSLVSEDEADIDEDQGVTHTVVF